MGAAELAAPSIGTPGGTRPGEGPPALGTLPVTPSQTESLDLSIPFAGPPGHTWRERARSDPGAKGLWEGGMSGGM